MFRLILLSLILFGSVFGCADLNQIVNSGQSFPKANDVENRKQDSKSTNQSQPDSKSATTSKTSSESGGDKSKEKNVGDSKREKLINELRTEVFGSKKSSVNKSDTIIGTVITTSEGSVTVNPDKKSGTIISLKSENTELTRDELAKFKRNDRVKLFCDVGTYNCNKIVKVTGKEAQIKITNRADCLAHYGTNGANQCFSKFKK